MVRRVLVVLEGTGNFGRLRRGLVEAGRVRGVPSRILPDITEIPEAL